MSSDAKNDTSPTTLTRRKILGGIGLALMAAPLGQLIAACGPGNEDEGGDTGGGTTTDPGAWATGGTAAMTAASTYPNPFASGIGSACKLTCEATLGPCYATTLDRKDISEGRDTTNTNDNVVSADSAPDYMFQTQRMPDGAMLAWKTLVIRSSLSNASCQMPGG
jgi:hypothetical protein